jgi:hypothetical protein
MKHQRDKTDKRFFLLRNKTDKRFITPVSIISETRTKVHSRNHKCYLHRSANGTPCIYYISHCHLVHMPLRHRPWSKYLCGQFWNEKEFTNSSNHDLGPVRLGWWAGWKTLLADLCWEKNTIPAEKTNWKRRIISRVNRLLLEPN